MTLLEQFRVQKAKMKANQGYLKRGVYVLWHNTRTYVHHRSLFHQTISFPKEVHSLKDGLRMAVGILFFSVWVTGRSKLPCEETADAVYFSSVPDPAYKDMKLFAQKAGKVRVLFGNRRRYDLYMNNRARTAECFPLPRLYGNEESALSYVEELIADTRQLDSRDGAKRVLELLFSFYVRYYQSGCVRRVHQEVFASADLPGELRITGEVPVCLHHGDLSADNFELDAKERLVFLDFDHAGEFPLFYDVLFFIFNESLAYCRDTAMELLKNGEFEPFFAQCGVNQQDALRYFINAYLRTRCFGINREADVILQKYHELCSFKIGKEEKA